MSRRGIIAYPILRAPVVFLPGCDARELSCQRLRAGRYDCGIATGWVRVDGNNQATCLIVPAVLGELFFCSIHDAVQFTRDYANHRLMSRLAGANTQKLQQLPDVELVLVRMLATKSAQGKQFVWLKISGARV